LLSYPEADYDILFSRPQSVDEVVWTGAVQPRIDMARSAGIETVEDIERLGVYLTKAAGQGLKVHYLPPYQGTALFRTAELLVMDPGEVVAGASRPLQEAIARQRNAKTDVEIAEIEDALGVSALMYQAAMKTARPGAYEHEVAGVMQGVALSHDREQAYPPIVTIHGEVLHNHSYHNKLEAGQLLLIDAGVESPRYYASDITRTYPVNGKFSRPQAEVYELVLRAEMSAIGMIKPGVDYKDVHMRICQIMVDGLKAIGLMKGNTDDAVAAGAHALFFPHGLGHMMGLDVHDMEDLGDIVGYSKDRRRSDQFGLRYLRLSRPLELGYVLTVEPGLYFIPALIDRWKQEKLQQDFVNYDKIEAFRGFGGIRIEDNVVVTPDGARVLGPGIPKTVSEIEAAMGGR
jgi:Xaa-Pro aminopeptidase